MHMVTENISNTSFGLNSFPFGVDILLMVA